ncbi:MAG: universal stress protein [Pseudomonadota bacterium]
MNEVKTAPEIPRLAARDGKRRKFLCVVDGTAECDKAVYFASRRAHHTYGGVTLLYVIPPADFQHWGAVEALMREEARAEGEAALTRQADRVFAVSQRPAELVFREGGIREEILALIKEDPDIAVLVLGTCTDGDGPGPLVSALAGRDPTARYPIPVTLVPGHLSDEEINFLA